MDQKSPFYNNFFASFPYYGSSFIGFTQSQYKNIYKTNFINIY